VDGVGEAVRVPVDTLVIPIDVAVAEDSVEFCHLSTTY
jgi:hypothetical protein